MTDFCGLSARSAGPAAHAAGEIAVRLLRDARETRPDLFTNDDHRLVRLTGLLHDIGHGVFSHVSDPLFERNDEKRGHEWIGAQRIWTRSETRMHKAKGS
jgi:HD superfamily phosphohydrolase